MDNHVAPDTPGEETVVRPIWRWLILTCSSLGMFLGTLDLSVNIALPSITRYFSTNPQTIQWIIIAYMGSRVGLQVSLGSAADIYGLKRFFVIGVAVYTVAVALIGLSPTLLLVFILRIAQAVGSGMMAASSPAIITQTFPSSERGKALGIMGAFGSLGMLVGILGGGFLLEVFSWRSIFLARVPIGILLILLAVFILPRQGSSPKREAFDLPGAIALFAALAGLLLAMNMGGRLGWTSPMVSTFGFFFVIGIGFFLYLEKRSSLPVLDFQLLKHKALTTAFAVAFLLHLGIFVNWFILPYYLSDTLNQGPRTMGMLLILTPLVAAMASLISGRISDRFPSPYLITIGTAFLSLSMVRFSLMDANSSVVDVTIALALTGIGSGTFQAAYANLVMGNLLPDRLATGAALMTLFLSLGSVFSVAVASIVFASRLDFHTAALADTGLAREVASGQAFVLAFQDTYKFAALVVGMAMAISLIAWSRRRHRPAGK